MRVVYEDDPCSDWDPIGRGFAKERGERALVQL